MSTTTKKLIVALIGLMVAVPVLSGCSGTGTAPLSKTDESNFKGGPMPASARATMIQKIQEARSKSHAPAPAR